MLNMAKFEIIGNVGKVEDGENHARVNIAVNETWTDKQGEHQEKTNWLQVTVFKPSLVKFVAEHLSTGRYIRATGAIRPNSYEKDGTTVYTTDLIASRIDFLSAKPKEGG